MIKFLLILVASCLLGLSSAGAQTPSTKPSSGDPAASSASNPSGSGASLPGGTDVSRHKAGTTGRAFEKQRSSDKSSTPATRRQKSGTNAEGTAKP
jgi:hypothetical protein